MKVNSQEFSELDIGGRETCKHNFENSDIFWRESFYIKIVEFYQELSSPRYGLSTPYRLTIRNSASPFF